MADNKMLIDATHPEETRVVVLRSGRVEEFDYESAARKLLRGNIYLAKVTRVELALQAAFVDYGGNRHGFLAFNEIHPDYYQIPIADRQALIDEEAEAAALAEAEVDARAEHRAAKSARKKDDDSNDADHSPENGDAVVDASGDVDGVESETTAEGSGEAPTSAALESSADDILKSDIVTQDDEQDSVETSDSADQSQDLQADADASGDSANADGDVEENENSGAESIEDEEADSPPEAFEGADFAEANAIDVFALDEPNENNQTLHDDLKTAVELEDNLEAPAPTGEGDESPATESDAEIEVEADSETGEETETVEDVGTSEDALDELVTRPRRSRRSYKIQEVIKRRQIILIQVVKEERGNKGAALTTYLSLAGRYTVLMPNTARGGGISRKITNPQDRKRLKAIAGDLEVPEGMGLIIRTAGASRTKQEIRRDYEYLLRLWESVREMTFESSAPSLVYEEGNLIKRSIRDLYNKEIDEILVAGKTAHREAKSFMRMMMPSHARNVTHYDKAQPLFTRFQIERQLNAMFSPFVTLKSGGYLVINQTEALVAVDVNSGKSTREFSIEETALNTNLEAVDELARQLRLRDLAGLIVIDFIDMDERRNNRAVERRMKDALKNDRARIQVGRISHFGLLEMSRQRMRSGVLEGSTTPCPHCQGTGIVRSTESIALAVIRGLEDAVMSGGRSSLVATTTPTVALYLLNNKRDFIIDIETRHGMPITIEGSEKIQGANFTIEKDGTSSRSNREQSTDKSVVNMDWGFEGENQAQDANQSERRKSNRSERNSTGDVDGEKPKRRSRRGRRGRGSTRNGDARNDIAAAENDVDIAESDANDASAVNIGSRAEDIGTEPSQTIGDGEHDASEEKPRRRRRRGRRGGRRARERKNAAEAAQSEPTGDLAERTEANSDDGSVDNQNVDGLGPQPVVSDEQPFPSSEGDVVAESGRRGPRRRPRRSSRKSDQTTQSPSSDGPDNSQNHDARDEGISEKPSISLDTDASSDPPDGEAPKQRTSLPNQVDPPADTQPATEQSDSDSVTATHPAQNEGSPRRGWWQRRLLGDT